MKLKVSLGIGLVGRREDVIEIEDGLTEEEIEREVSLWVWEYIDYGWKEVE